MRDLGRGALRWVDGVFRGVVAAGCEAPLPGNLVNCMVSQYISTLTIGTAADWDDGGTGDMPNIPILPRVTAAKTV